MSDEEDMATRRPNGVYMQHTFSWQGHEHTLDNVPAFASLPAATQAYLVDYGWKQCLSDAYASAKNADEFRGKLMKRFDKLLAGTMSLGTGRGPALDPVEKEFRAIVKSKVDEWQAERKRGGKAKASAELVEVWVNNVLDTDACRELAERNVAQRAQVATVADISDEELLAMLPTAEPEEEEDETTDE